MRSKPALVLVLVVAALAAPVLAAPARGPVGLGVYLGSPTGLTVGFDLTRSSWIDGVVAWDFANANGARLSLRADYVLAFPGTFVIEGEDIVPFVGAGALVSIGDPISVALMLPFGLDYTFRKTPIELYLELALGMALVPATDFVGGGGLGVRYRISGK